MKENTEVEVVVGVDLVEAKVEVGEKEVAIVDIGIEILEKERNIENEILEKMPQDIDELTKIRYLYIELAKRLNYDVGYFADGAKAVESYWKILNFENMTNNKVVCKGWAELFAQIVKDAGIDENRVSIKRPYTKYDSPGKPTGQHRWVEIDFGDHIIRADPTAAFNHTIDFSAIKSGSQTYGFIIIDSSESGKRISSDDIEQGLSDRTISFDWLREIDNELGYTKKGKYYGELSDYITKQFYSPSLVERIFGIKDSSINNEAVNYLLGVKIPKNMNAYEASIYINNLRHILFSTSTDLRKYSSTEFNYIKASERDYVGVVTILIENPDQSYTCRLIADSGEDKVYTFENIDEYQTFKEKNSIIPFRE